MKILKEEDYKTLAENYSHLVDIGMPPLNLLKNENISFQIRDEVKSGGTLLLGDLLVKKHGTSVLEAHPFPEWVIQLHIPWEKSGKVYTILPNFSSKQIKRLNRKNVGDRIKKTKKYLKDLSNEDFIAIEYTIGTSIKINANVPHEFISVVNEEKNENIPYCQVFEPNLVPISQMVKFDVTNFYNLKNEMKI